MKAELEIKGNSAEDAFQKMQKAMEEIEAVLMPGSKYLIHGKNDQLNSDVIYDIISYYSCEEVLWITSVIDNPEGLCKFILKINKQTQVIVTDDIQSYEYLRDYIYHLDELVIKPHKGSPPSIVLAIDFELAQNQIDSTFEAFTIINSSNYICY